MGDEGERHDPPRVPRIVHPRESPTHANRGRPPAEVAPPAPEPVPARPQINAPRTDPGRAASPSTDRPYGLARVCRALEIPRSTVYAARRRRQAPAVARKRGPKTAWTDTELSEHIRGVLAASPFVGEGHRKVWARLRAAGIHTSKPRVLRLMREAGLLAPTRAGRAHGPKAHDGTIIPGRPDAMGGIDATAGWTYLP